MKKMMMALILVLIIPITTWAAEENPPSQDDPSEIDDLSAIQDTTTIAETSFLGENFNLIASLKLWWTVYQQELSDGQKIDTSAPMFGPAVNLIYKDKFFTGISYYRGSGFDYSIDARDTVGEDIDVDVMVTKSDFDIWAGLNFHQRIAAFLGYKYMNLDLKLDYPSEFNVEQVAEQTLKGPVVGITVNYPIKESGVIFFGTFGYVFLNSDADIETRVYDDFGNLFLSSKDKLSSDYNGPALEVGASCIIPKFSRLSLTGGFKYQNYINENENDDNFTFSGITFGINYRFYR